jgi:hypothetical protein
MSLSPVTHLRSRFKSSQETLYQRSTYPDNRNPKIRMIDASQPACCLFERERPYKSNGHKPVCNFAPRDLEKFSIRSTEASPEHRGREISPQGTEEEDHPPSSSRSWPRRRNRPLPGHRRRTSLTFKIHLRSEEAEDRRLRREEGRYAPTEEAGHYQDTEGRRRSPSRSTYAPRKPYNAAYVVRMTATL